MQPKGTSDKVEGTPCPTFTTYELLWSLSGVTLTLLSVCGDGGMGNPPVETPTRCEGVFSRGGTTRWYLVTARYRGTTQDRMKGQGDGHKGSYRSKRGFGN